MRSVPNRSQGRSGALTFTVLAFRFLAGRDLDGQRRTDATFTRHASRDLTAHGRASRWAHKRHAERAGIRLAALSATVALAWALVWHRYGALLALAVTLAAGAALALWRVTVAARRLAHTWRVVAPLYRTIAPHAYHSPSDSPRRHLTVPRNYGTHDKAVVKLMLSPNWEGTPAQRHMLTTVMVNRLGGDWVSEYRQDVYPPYAAFRRLPQPPKRVSIADITSAIDSTPENILTLGRGASNQVIAIDMDSESPHIALSMGTGGGKTDTVALIITQLVRKRCERIDIIDPKRVSHNWARGLPGVHIQRYVAGQMEAINNARILMDARYDAMDANPDQIFARHVLIIEEQNSLIEDLKQYWEDYRRELTPQERGTTPKNNPAISDLRYILNKGRQCRINVISIYQRMSAAATGGGDARENYGAKILARCSPQTWRILVGTNPVPAAARSRIPGRAAYVLGDENHAVQRAYAGIAKPDGSADREGIARLRAFALNGQPDTGQPVTGASAPVSAPGAPEPELVTLREACDSGALSMRYSAARKARQRDKEFPPGVSRNGVKVYPVTDLAAWKANRLRERQVS